MKPGTLTPPDDVAQNFDLVTELHDHLRREVMIPMRDGVQLFTVIVSPKYLSKPVPMLLARTPYDASQVVPPAASPCMAMQAAPLAVPRLPPEYIHVFQDVRGKHRSEGHYTVYRPVRGPLNPEATDHVTDAWDTIEWLIANVPGNNGRVGMTGVSYVAFTTLMALLDPHPALKAAVPVNPAVDGWIGDDTYHNGAFRQASVEWFYWQTTSRDSRHRLPMGHYDTYTAFLAAGSAADFAQRSGAGRLRAWQRVQDNPVYNEFWQEQALDRLLAAVPARVPTLYVHSLFDQEDIYGALAAYRAMRQRDDAGSDIRLFIGPWYHNQVAENGSTTGCLDWHQDTVRFFNEEVFLPFLRQHLEASDDSNARRGERPMRVTAFETGTNRWCRYDDWPPPLADGMRKLYLRESGALSWDAPQHDPSEPCSEFVSDPAKPVPYRVRPIPAMMSDYPYWSRWLVDDQRPFSSRPDVLVFVSDVLVNAVTIRGEVSAVLCASTTGSDADWVVKLIDVYPDEVAEQPQLGGYELMISAEIFRGRYRQSFSRPRPIPSGDILEYRIRMPHAHHCFRPGHRIMVQLQSSWFPLYDRNPQQYVDNIAHAQRGDYCKAVHQVFHGRDAASHILLPVCDGEVEQYA